MMATSTSLAGIFRSSRIQEVAENTVVSLPSPLSSLLSAVDPLLSLERNPVRRWTCVVAAEAIVSLSDARKM